MTIRHPELVSGSIPPHAPLRGEERCAAESRASAALKQVQHDEIIGDMECSI
jgi:hypothetical protein